ncbi:ATP-dependent Clp protease proteolytic subunit-like [Helianthus annuus]|uniref:ATP-dependent Clp protease proteolytic subunit-like n=1 Tax=Helianthus annuus TaxID=4232 RepID=UPI0016530EF3|nr:ATP-dependent Clp protease proteolytic subunit-like [Helianthus annuus]
MGAGHARSRYLNRKEGDAEGRASDWSEVVTSEISNQLIGLMIYLSIEDDTQDLYLFINSPGGWVIPGVALYDTMQFVQPDVHTICMGSAASMGSFILVCVSTGSVPGSTLKKRNLCSPQPFRVKKMSKRLYLYFLSIRTARSEV